MSVRIMTAVWAASIVASDKLVLLALADCANDEGRCWPGLASLCAKTGKCKRSLQESMRALETEGHITRTPNPGKGMFYAVHPVAITAPVEEAATGSKITHKGVAKSAPKPLGTIIGSEAKASSPRGAKAFPPPHRVSAEQWSAFSRQRKKPLNDRSYLLLSNKLHELAEAGWPPGDMIDLAIERGWETVFKPRDFANDRQQHSSRTSEAVHAAVGDDPYAPF